MAHLVLDKEDKLKLIFECFTLIYEALSIYGIYLEVSKEVSAKAEQSIIDERKNTERQDEVICREDVWTKIIAEGGTITFIDEQGSVDDVGLNLDLIDKNISKCNARVVLDILDEDGNYDVDSVDHVMQCLLYGEQIFG